MAAVGAALEAFWSGRFQDSFDDLAPILAREMRNGIAPELATARHQLLRYVADLEELRRRAEREIARGERADEARLDILHRQDEVKSDAAAAPPEQKAPLQQQTTHLEKVLADKQKAVTQAQANLAGIRKERQAVDKVLASRFQASAHAIERGRVLLEQQSTNTNVTGSNPGTGTTDPGAAVNGPGTIDPIGVGPGIGDPTIGAVSDPSTGAIAGTGMQGILATRGRFDPTGADVPGLGGKDERGLSNAQTAALAGGGAALLAGGGYAAARAAGGSVPPDATRHAGVGAAAPGASARRVPGGSPSTVDPHDAAEGEGGRAGAGGPDGTVMAVTAAVAASAAAGIVLGGRRLDRAPGTAGVASRAREQRLFRIGRRSLGEPNVDRLEKLSTNDTDDGAVGEPGTTDILPGGVVADLPAGWTVSRTEDCAVLSSAGPTGRFRPNIVVIADDAAPADPGAGVEELPASVLLEAEVLTSSTPGNRSRFGYALGSTALTVHRQQLASRPGTTAVVTGTVATERAAEDLPIIDRILSSFRPAPDLAPA
jgi:hypothetical protein